MKSKRMSIISMTCPRCRKGKLFVTPYRVSTAYQMLEACPHCSQSYQPEPGFYYGAMFVSYILSAWLFLGIGLTLVFGFSWSILPTLLTVLIVTVLLHNYLFRISRSIWIHLFVKFDSKYE